MSTATERALNVDGGVWLAMNEHTGAVLWPRCLYPSADDALDAHAAWLGFLDNPDVDCVKLTWAVGSHATPGWWWWWCDEYRASWEAIECWEVGP